MESQKYKQRNISDKKKELEPNTYYTNVGAAESKNQSKKHSHLQDEDLIFGSLADLPSILLQELFTRVHLHRGSVLGSEYLTELLPERKNFMGLYNKRDLEGREDAV